MLGPHQRFDAVPRVVRVCPTVPAWRWGLYWSHADREGIEWLLGFPVPLHFRAEVDVCGFDSICVRLSLIWVQFFARIRIPPARRYHGIVIFIPLSFRPNDRGVFKLVL